MDETAIAFPTERKVVFDLFYARGAAHDPSGTVGEIDLFALEK